MALSLAVKLSFSPKSESLKVGLGEKGSNPYFCRLLRGKVIFAMPVECSSSATSKFEWG